MDTFVRMKGFNDSFDMKFVISQVKKTWYFFLVEIIRLRLGFGFDHWIY